MQVLKEILNVLDGNSVDVTRAGSTASEYLDTSQIFFVCFGNFEERGFPHTSYDKSVTETQKFNLSSTSPCASDCESNDSGNGSGEQRHGCNLPNDQTSRRDSQMSTDTRYEFLFVKV